MGNNTMIRVENAGPLITSTNYWQTKMSDSGYYYISPNSGVFRILIPPARSGDIAEMRTAKHVVITIGSHRDDPRYNSEFLFDDETDEPFVLWFSTGQWERLPAAEDFGKSFELTAWENRRGNPHKVLSRLCYLRNGELPCIQPWQGQT